MTLPLGRAEIEQIIPHRDPFLLLDEIVELVPGSHALARRTVPVIVLPNDLQDEPYEDPPRAHGTLQSGVGYVAPKIVPYDIDLDRAAEVDDRPGVHFDLQMGLALEQTLGAP